MSPNRVVALLTPVFFVPAAGYIATLAAKHLPGVEVDQGQITAVFVAGALSVLPPMWKWLDGWQKYEQREQDAELATRSAVHEDEATWPGEAVGSGGDSDYSYAGPA